MTNNRHRLGPDDPGRSAGRVTVTRGYAGFRRRNAVNDNKASLTARLFRAFRILVIVLAAGLCGWALLR